jgi:aarF domain-containing kinase
MHPSLELFSAADLALTKNLLNLVKSYFPNFEFSWLGEEMEQNLPLEMDFRHEAANAERCRRDFENVKGTSLVIPEVRWMRKRVLVMECELDPLLKDGSRLKSFF